MKARSTPFLCLVLLSACARETPPATILLTEAEQLVVAAEAEPTASGKVPLLENARRKLHRIVGYHPSAPLAADLREGRVVGTLSLPEVDRRVREARMDACLEAASYDCLIENALTAARVHLESGRGHDSVAVAQARLGDAAGALATVEEILGSGLAIPEWRTVPLLELVALVQAAQGDIEGARATAERIWKLNAAREYPFFPDHVRAAIAIAQAHAGEPDSAMVSLADLSRQGVAFSARVLTRVARVRAEAGDAAGAAQALEEAAAMLGPDAGRYPIVPLERHSVQLVFRDIADAQAEMGDIQGADETVSRAIGVAEQVQASVTYQSFPLVHALADFASMWAAGGDRNRAVRLLRRAREATGQLQGDPGRRALLLLTPYLAEFGEIETAWTVADRLTTESSEWMLHLRAWRAIALRLIEAGDAARAERAADRMGTGFHRLVANIRAASARGVSGDSATADQLLTGIGAEVVRNGVPGYEWQAADRFAQAALLRMVAAGLAQIGNTGRAAAILAEAISAASEIEVPSAIARAGYPDPLPDLLPREDSVGAFVKALTEVGDLGDSSLWLPSWEDGLYRGWALQAISCVADSAGIPVARETLREAALAAGESRYDVGSWVLRAAALALLARPCRDEFVGSPGAGGGP